MRFLLAGMLAVSLAGGLNGADTANQPSAKKSALDKPTLEAYVRHLLVWGPQIKVEISDPQPSDLDGFHLVNVKGSAGAAAQEQSFYISKDGQKILRAAVFDISKNPFHKDFERITTMDQPSLGTPGAPVRVVVFTDFQCPYCRKEAEMLRQNLVSTFPKEVRLYFKDFPLDSIHPWARDAAVAGRCVYRQSEEAFWKYHDWIFAQQNAVAKETLQAKVVEFAGSLQGVDVLKLQSCIENRETEAEVNRSVAEARELGINATPTVFINGRRIPAQIPWANMKQVIEFELDYQKTAKNAGDIDCCAVKLPSPLGQ